ncbi:hypothetical protein TEA_029652 [Camellia sinensis var. sinensis]|uniref:Sey1/RHD3-like three-helix bundle domain-containing protein n=1 Tax=Camellia sinensis var. sinensis TaxID=542762 RepID=A0A4S4CYU5_CAMSN|nr:hypothetical protein TEA_029652 [Camellia sinensis var. sinensis]
MTSDWIPLYFQEASKRSNNWLPPPWAIVALVVLGFNEFMTLLRNPLYLVVIFVVFLLVKALWVQLDISGEFRNGAVSVKLSLVIYALNQFLLPGLLSLATKFLPTVINLLKKLAEEGQMPATTGHQMNNSSLGSTSFHSGVDNNGDMSSSDSSEVTSTENGTEYSSSSAHEKVPHTGAVASCENAPFYRVLGYPYLKMVDSGSFVFKRIVISKR